MAKKKSAAQLDREIAAWIAARDAARNNPTPENREVAKTAWAALDAASPRQRRMGTFASRAGQRQAAERRAMTAKRSHSTKTPSHPPGFPDLRVGQLFDHFGHIYEITKIGRDKKRTVQIARRIRDLFGKETLIDQRSFPDRDFDRQHLKPIDAQTAAHRGRPALVR